MKITSPFFFGTWEGEFASLLPAMDSYTVAYNEITTNTGKYRHYREEFGGRVSGISKLSASGRTPRSFFVDNGTLLVNWWVVFPSVEPAKSHEWPRTVSRSKKYGKTPCTELLGEPFRFYNPDQLWRWATLIRMYLQNNKTHYPLVCYGVWQAGSDEVLANVNFLTFRNLFSV